MVKQIVSAIQHSGSKKAEVIRFGITGGIATLLQYVVYLVLVASCSMSPEVSTVVSYVISFAANFFLSNYFTFRTKPNGKRAGSFAASHAINLGMQTVLVWAFTKVMPAEYALLPAMAICIPVNFFLVRFALKSKRFDTTK
ncbi:MAG: GtrA family protein [Muribaculaceae bacterium]|nr:GtrA family protein [Muribaculaceae bacterium]